MSDPSTSPGASTPSSFKFDAKRWSAVDRNVGIATFVFFVSLFLPWFGVSGGLYSFSVNGLWHGYMYLPLLLAIALIAYLVLLAGMEKLPFDLPLPHALALTIVTGIIFVLTLISFITKPGGTGWKFGSFIGLIAAAVAFAPFAIPKIREMRSKRSNGAAT